MNKETIAALNYILIEEPLKETKTYCGGHVISQKENMILTSPMNSWDMNYHLYELETGQDHLIDIDDVVDTLEEQEEYEAALLFKELKEFELDELKEYSWKTV